MPEISIDAHEVRELAADFTRIPGELSRHAIPVLSKGALNIKNQMREEMSASASFGFLARSITYDLHTEGTEYSAEVGPVKTQGAKTKRHVGANIAYFGSYKGGGTVADPREALEAEAPKFTEALADLAEELFG